jgi:class 3 adenylate cyclase
MSVKTEIELLDRQLLQCSDDAEAATLLLTILNNFNKLNSPDSEPYLRKLETLAEAPGGEYLGGWVLFYEGILAKNRARNEEAIAQLEKAYTAFEKQGQLDGMIRTSINLGILWRVLCNYTEALRHQQNGLKKAEAAGDNAMTGLALNNIGNVYMLQANYPEALIYHMRAMQLRLSLGDVFGLSASHRNIGNIYFKQGRFDEALAMYIESLRGCERLGDESGIASSNYNIGLALDMQQRYADAIPYIHASAEMFIKLGDERNYGYAMSSLGLNYFRTGNRAEAHRILAETQQLFERINDTSGLTSTIKYLAMVYQSEAAYDEALRCLETSGNYAEQLGVRDQLAEIYRMRSEIFEVRGNAAEAFRWFRKYHETEKEILGVQTQQQLMQLHFQHDIEQKEAVHKATERILHNILPQAIAERIKNGDEKIIQHFEEASCLFADMAGFTTWSAQRDVNEVAETLNTIFNLFDELVVQHGAEKIKTIGDAYMCVAGLPEPCTDHAQRLAKLALAMNEAIRTTWPGGEINVRIGIHSGEVIAGVLGKNKYAYDLWGDTVNTASRMESSGAAGKVNISEATRRLLGDAFTCNYRGEIEAKGKGKLKMYFLEGAGS